MKKTYEIAIGTLRKELAQWVARSAEGDTVIILQYHRPVSQLVAYTPGLVGDEDEYAPGHPQEPPLYPAYYAADTRHSDASRTIADVLAKCDRKLASRLARIAIQLEMEALKSQEAGQWIEEVPRRLVTLEELEQLAPINEDSWRDKRPPSGNSSAVNSAIKKK